MEKEQSVNQSGVNCDDEQIAKDRNKKRVSQYKRQVEKIDTTALKSVTMDNKIDESSDTSYIECNNGRHIVDNQETGAVIPRCHFQQSVTCKTVQHQPPPPEILVIYCRY